MRKSRILEPAAALDPSSPFLPSHLERLFMPQREPLPLSSEVSLLQATAPYDSGRRDLCSDADRSLVILGPLGRRLWGGGGGSLRNAHKENSICSATSGSGATISTDQRNSTMPSLRQWARNPALWTPEAVWLTRTMAVVSWSLNPSTASRRVPPTAARSAF